MKAGSSPGRQVLYVCCKSQGLLSQAARVCLSTLPAAYHARDCQTVMAFHADSGPLCTLPLHPDPPHPGGPSGVQGVDKQARARQQSAAYLQGSCLWRACCGSRLASLQVSRLHMTDKKLIAAYNLGTMPRSTVCPSAAILRQPSPTSCKNIFYRESRERKVSYIKVHILDIGHTKRPNL